MAWLKPTSNCSSGSISGWLTIPILAIQMKTPRIAPPHSPVVIFRGVGRQNRMQFHCRRRVRCYWPATWHCSRSTSCSPKPPCHSEVPYELCRYQCPKVIAGDSSTASLFRQLPADRVCLSSLLPLQPLVNRGRRPLKHDDRPRARWIVGDLHSAIEERSISQNVARRGTRSLCRLLFECFQSLLNAAHCCSPN